MGGRCCRHQSATKVHVTTTTATATTASKYAIEGEGSALTTSTTAHQAVPSNKKNPPTSKQKGDEALEISNLADVSYGMAISL